MKEERTDLSAKVTNVDYTGNNFISLAQAASEAGEGTMTVTGSSVNDLRTTGPIEFSQSVILCLAEGAELTLKGGMVTIGDVTVNGKLILDSTTLIILGDLSGSGSIELVEESDVYVGREVNLDGNITGSGSIETNGA